MGITDAAVQDGEEMRGNAPGTENEARLVFLLQNDHWPEEPRRHTPDGRRQPVCPELVRGFNEEGSRPARTRPGFVPTKGGLCARALNSVTK